MMRSKEKSFYALIFSFFQVGCTAMFYSTQGSAQPKETGESCTIEPDCAEAPLMLTYT